jgi:hypothetical protein
MLGDNEDKRLEKILAELVDARGGGVGGCEEGDDGDDQDECRPFTEEEVRRILGKVLAKLGMTPVPAAARHWAKESTIARLRRELRRDKTETADLGEAAEVSSDPGEREEKV